MVAGSALPLAAIGCAIAIVAPVAAQQLVWTRQGSPLPFLVMMNGPIAAIGDIDRDGYEDVVQSVGAPLPMYGFWIFSGRDGSTLRIHPHWTTDSSLQALVRAGDVDGDGVGDFAVGLNGTQQAGFVAKVQVFSGRIGAVLREVRGWSPELFGWHIAGDLDVDGDDKPDLVVGAERAGATNWPWPARSRSTRTRGRCCTGSRICRGSRTSVAASRK